MNITDDPLKQVDAAQRRRGWWYLLAALCFGLLTTLGAFALHEASIARDEVTDFKAGAQERTLRIENLESALEAQRRQFEACKDKESTAPGCATAVAPPAAEIGPPGLPGIQGLAGRDGLNGSPGADGADGRDGKDGLNGEPGSTGATGTAGKDGSSGTDGKDGATGATGPAGKDGADGKDGATGATGATGPQGPPGTFPSTLVLRYDGSIFTCTLGTDESYNCVISASQPDSNSGE